MRKIFFVFLMLAFVSTGTVYGQVSLVPLSQYTVANGSSDANSRTSAVVQSDTLKIPYIEDFSGAILPVDTIIPVVFSGTEYVYQIKHLKLHGLTSGTSINILSVTGDTAYTDFLTGKKFVKVIDRYTFQLFNDTTLSEPAFVTPEYSKQMRYINWSRYYYGGYSTYPDSLGFVDNKGGVFINDDMSANPINTGVATFDGVNYLGIPYSSSNSNGYADNLTSLPFNLSSYKRKDSVAFSFYWQSKSLGDSPFTSEYLLLEFKDSSGTWREQWRQYGNPAQTIDTFRRAYVRLTDSLYLHKSFQYRFRNYGALNGRFNVWNVDYIYFNKNIKKKDTLSYLTYDMSFIHTTRNALKNYTSIPYKHFIALSAADQMAQTNTDFNISVRDFRFYINSTFSTDFELRSRYNTAGSNSLVNTSGLTKSVRFNVTFPPPAPIASTINQPFVLKQEFAANMVDTLGPIDLTFNNFKSIETYFYDYYAYDDNTPELAFSATQQFNQGIRVANKFTVLKADTLAYIDYCFIKNYGPDATNSIITLTVWKDGESLVELLSQQINLKYSTIINGFVRYPVTFTSAAILAPGSYYFGFKHVLQNPVFLGYDRNNDYSAQIFSSTDNATWVPFSSTGITAKGALMIRPVFANTKIITGIPDAKESLNQFTIYPNPSSGELHLSGQPEYISVYDLRGKLIRTIDMHDTEWADLTALSNGIYVLVLQKDGYSETKRFIVQK